MVRYVNGVPVPDEGFSVYDSYTTDPRYQLYFTYAWVGTLALFVAAIGLPRAIRRGLSRDRWLNDENGWVLTRSPLPLLRRIRRMPPPSRQGSAVKCTSTPANAPAYAPVKNPKRSATARSNHMASKTRQYLSTLRFRNVTLRLPFGLSYNITPARAAVCVLPIVFFLVTLLPEAQLTSNPNRAGFILLAHLPPLFLLSSKLPPFLLPALLSPQLGTYTALNFLHRLVGRLIILLGLIHGGMWMSQWKSSGVLKARMSGEKEQRGLLAFVVLLLIGMTSVRLVRKLSYPIFFTLHVILMVVFIVAINRHTIYARNWTIAVVAIVATDWAARLARLRWVWARVEPVVTSAPERSDGVRVTLQGPTGGWRAGQHLQLQLLFNLPTCGGSCSDLAATSGYVDKWRALRSCLRMFEMHPFSISNAPVSTSARISQREGDMQLFVRRQARGSWTDDLCALADSFAVSDDPPVRSLRPSKSFTSDVSSSVKDDKSSPLDATLDIPDDVRRFIYVPAIVQGTWGGLGYAQPEHSQTVVLIAGGSGMSFIFGVLDDVIGKAATSVEGIRTSRVELVWIVRDRAHIQWFLTDLRRLILSAPPQLDVRTIFYVTGCTASQSPDALPVLPTGAEVHFSGRPSIPLLLSRSVEEAINPCGPACGRNCACDGDDNSSVSASSQDPNGEKDILAKAKSDDVELGELRSTLGSGCKCASSSQGNGTCCCSGRAVTGPPPLPSYARLDAIPSAPGAIAPSAQHVSGRRRRGGLFVTACGPESLTNDIQNAVATLAPSRSARIGGVSLHVERYSV